jgi:hypothetical protein
MRRFSMRCAALPLAALVLGACGGKSGPSGPGNGGGGQLSAAIDGQAFSSSAGGAQAVAGGPGIYTLAGSRATSAANATTISFALYNIGGTGSYPLGVSGLNFGGLAVLGLSSSVWTTPLSGAAGTITITTLTATRIAGTFSFIATPSPGSGATGTKTVTNGQFDLPVTRTSTPFGAIPDNLGSRAGATIAGAPWSAATVVVSYNSGTLALGFSNDQRILSLIFANVTAPGTYPLASPSAVTALGGSSNPSALCCWNTATGNTGSLVVTSLTATRIKGTFSFTLSPTPNTNASGPLVITNGQFDVGLP